MSTPDDHAAPTTDDAPAPPTVRACERCGTVCGSDQEWCLNCGVRLTEASQRLPGLRTASTVVVLAVLLAGGAAAASYAALRGDARQAANAAAPPSANPVPQDQPTVTDPVPPTSTGAAPPASGKLPSAKAPSSSSSSDTSKASSAPPVPVPSGPSTPSGGGSGSGSSGGSSGSSGGSSSGVSTGSGGASHGPITFSAGQGKLYDPDEVLSDTGEENNATDSSASTAWKFTLKPKKTGGFGYTLDFSDPSSVRSLTITTPTSGLVVKILGTTSSRLPKDVLDPSWNTLASRRTLTGARHGKKIALKNVTGATRKYRHVLVYFSKVPGSPAKGQINKLSAAR